MTNGSQHDMPSVRLPFVLWTSIIAGDRNQCTLHTLISGHGSCLNTFLLVTYITFSDHSDHPSRQMQK